MICRATRISVSLQHNSGGKPLPERLLTSRTAGLAPRTGPFVRHFADTEFDALTQNIVEQLQGIDAAGIYGDDYGHKTLWDEYCHEIQEGPLGPLDHAWDRTTTPFLTEALANIPQEAAVLMTIGAKFRLEEDDEQVGDLASNPDLMRRYSAQATT